MSNMHAQWNEGDWVSGRTRSGEKFRGYLECIDLYHGLARVKVLESEYRPIIGRNVDTLLLALEPIQNDTMRTEKDLMALIDLALETRDRAWFTELAEQLAVLRGGTDQRQRSAPAFT